MKRQHIWYGCMCIIFKQDKISVIRRKTGVSGIIKKEWEKRILSQLLLKGCDKEWATFSPVTPFCDVWWLEERPVLKKRMERHMQVFSSRLASFSSELIITWCPPWRWQSGQKEEVDSALGPFSLAAPVGKMGLISADSTSGVSPTSSHHLCTQGMVQGALVRMTRSQISSQITVSPRGGLALCRGSRWV